MRLESWLNNIPYIGVTGIGTPSEVRQLCDEVLSTLPDGYFLMNGVLVNSETLDSQHSSQFPRRYPEISTFHQYMQPYRRLFNIAHFHTSDKMTRLFDQLERVRREGGLYLDGVQLNMVWPSLSEVQEFSHCLYEGSDPHSPPCVIFQLNQTAMQKAGSPEMAAEQIHPYVEAGAITHVLIDGSGGQGLPLDPDKALSYLRPLSQIHPLLGLVVAGGLHRHSLGQLDPILLEFPRISIDGESGFRHPTTDSFIYQEARNYVIRSSAKLRAI